MNPEVRNLFHEVADLPMEERERIFRERRIAPEVRVEVESLLDFDAGDGDLLTGCVSQAADEVLRSAAPERVACGPYRLVRLLGSGGMGAVYLGERADGEIEQRVAIKLLRADSDRAAWRERFLRERQLLASLHHPAIAHAIDAGHASDGRPYLAMEYVEGVPIDVYCARLDLRATLLLFLRVCDGVSHAHGHLIIHRDLKPSNILVDGSGQPKLLDFGIAKLLDETAENTQTAERLLTPNYASPEQLRGELQTVAGDVYSLGAVLYKLVAGRSPHEAEDHSSRALEILAGKGEISDVRRINPRVPADLDSILRKTLRPEPDERYASVEALAGDIRAFLESRPVAARAGNAWYRTRKFLRRYWLPAAAAALVIASLSVGFYTAERQRRIAERRFGQLRQLSNKVFELDKAIRYLPGSTAARQQLVSASLQYLEGLAADAHGDVDLAQEIGDAYERVARVQGVPNELNLGEFANAEATLKKADAFMETVLASRPRSRQALFSSARIAHDRMILAQSENRRTEAVAYAQNAARRLDAFFGAGPTQATERDEAAGIYANIALAYINMDMDREAIPYARRCADLARSLPPGGEAETRLSTGLSLLASALRDEGELMPALEAIEEARRIAERTTYTNETIRMIDMFGVLYREGMILGEAGGVNLGRVGEAAAVLQEAVNLTEAAARKSPNDYASRSRLGNCGIALGDILRDRDPRRALAVYDLTIRRLREIQNNADARRDEASALAGSSYALLELHRASEAKRRINQALAILQQTGDYPAGRIALDRRPVLNVVMAAADFQAATGDPRRAIQMYEGLLGEVMAAQPRPFMHLRDAPPLSRIYESLGRLYRIVGDHGKAESMHARQLELWGQWNRKLPGNVFVRRQLEAAGG
ncbi:MAG TPA: serine/threonine-protein kinase [Bryobacteraceae bacterium]|nr:serine/threonine-protein kinase [Bryobacteraceae bacterium]